jgi:hypothetical protein
MQECEQRRSQMKSFWSTIGAIAQATTRMKVTTALTCPTVRIHPAIVAEAAATSAVLLEGRFALGLVSGEALNEHILGDRWLPGELGQILPTPAHLEQASELVSEERIAESIPCRPDLDAHLEKIREYEAAGFDELYVQQVGDGHERMFELHSQEILPRYSGS